MVDGAKTRKPGAAGQGGAAEEGEMAKAYRPGEVEHAIYQSWVDADVFNPDGKGSRADWSKQPFVIIQPPPNVTGSLHLGHAQRSTVEDLMTRHAEMQGRPALFLPGLDHASIAAQYVLDKILARKGETRQTLGREKYLEAMWEFVRETRETILGQQRRVGASLDMSRLRFTWTRSRRAPCARPSCASTVKAWRTAPKPSSTGAPAAVPAFRTSRSSKGNDGQPVDDALPPGRREDRRARPKCLDRGCHDAARDSVG